VNARQNTKTQPMAKKQNIQYFTVGESEYTEIGDDLFLVLGRWGNTIMLIYNDKSKPKWGETNVSQGEIIKGGNGFYFIVLHSPRKLFLGMNTCGTFLQYYIWLLGEHKLEAPVSLISTIAKEEALNINNKPRKYKHLPLLSDVCKSTWHLLGGKDPLDPKNYYSSRSAYHLLTPYGEIAKDNSRNHLMLELLIEDLPPLPLIESRLNKWKAGI